MTRAAAPPRALLYLAVALIAGAVIALQIGIMRVFAVGSWAHFGSLVVSLAMLGFGLTSAVMCVATPWLMRHWRAVSAWALLSFGPLVVGAHLTAQQLPFNAIFLVADPVQKWRLLANFLLYLLPFLAGASFLGIVFLKARTSFSRFYFADLAGSGLCGLLFLGAMWVLRPENLLVVPLALWAAGSLLWFRALRIRGAIAGLASVAVLSLTALVALPPALDISRLAVSDYKGVAYARKFPDSQRLLEHSSPFGQLEVYASSYLHFAPGLSDNAAFNLPSMPGNAYLGLYIDGDGPSGIIRKLEGDQAAYFRYLPMFYPYLLKSRPDTFVVQFGGGISTALALQAGSRAVTVAEGNPTVLEAFRTERVLRDFTGDVLHDARVTVIDHDGRLYLKNTPRRFDIVDLSLADSAGLSSPGGFAVVEKFSYTREAFVSYLRALKPGGILSVTLWNKEEPPKSTLKLYATLVAAARAHDPTTVARSFYAVSSYLSTTTVLYKQGGFTPGELATLQAHTRAMSWDELFGPAGLAVDYAGAHELLAAYRDQIFAEQPGRAPASLPFSPASPSPARRDTATAAADPAGPARTAAGPARPADEAGSPEGPDPATTRGAPAIVAYPTAGVPPTPAAPGLAPPASPAVTTWPAALRLRPEAPMDFPSAGAAPAAGSPDAGPDPAPPATTLPSVALARLAWHAMVHGGWSDLARRHVFDTRELTNDRAYFTAYIKPADLPRVTDRLELLQDEWGYLLLWATLAIACATAAVLVAFPVVFGWRTIFAAYPGKALTILYFACLGLGYIMVEVGLIAHFVLALSNATVSASVLITGMLVFSGLGSLVSERYQDRARQVMPVVFGTIGGLLIAYGLFIDTVLDAIGVLPYGWRLVACFGLIAPPAFLMGFPMPMAMTWLARLKKQPMLLWAWGINGCFSVIGAAAVPIVATGFGLSAVLGLAGAAYLLAIPAFFAVLLPVRDNSVPTGSLL